MTFDLDTGGLVHFDIIEVEFEGQAPEFKVPKVTRGNKSSPTARLTEQKQTL